MHPGRQALTPLRAALRERERDVTKRPQESRRALLEIPASLVVRG